MARHIAKKLVKRAVKSKPRKPIKRKKVGRKLRRF